MKKIPTLFVRDFDSTDRTVINEVTPGCEWVLKGEGIAHRKYDGTCTKLEGGVFYKRREIKKGKKAPASWTPAGPPDPITGKVMGWMPVSFDAAEDKYFVEAYINSNGADLPDGTYECVGPKFQANPESTDKHILISHDRAEVIDIPRDFDGIMEFLKGINYEGVVFKRYLDKGTEENEMCKIKASDVPR